MGREHMQEGWEDEHPLRKGEAELGRSAASPAASLTRQRPLIDQVTNSWRDNEKSASQHVEEGDNHELRFCDLEDEGSCPNVSRDLMRSRRFRKMIVVVILALLALWYGWSWYVQPRLEEEWDLKQGFMVAGSNGTFGLARGGHFDGTRIHELDEKLIPGGHGDPEGERRLVFVGDIHGCKKELKHLLSEIDYNEGTDHLIATGDVVSKGPDNVGVLNELIRLKASSVRGNHEDRLLEVAKTLLPSSLNQQSTAETTSKGHAKDAALLKHLKPKHLHYLRSMPLVLRIPALPLRNKRKGRDHHHITTDILVVHAGLVPHVPLPKQDPYMVMNMRSIDTRTHVPSALRTTKKGRSRPWLELWNWYNDRVAKGRSLKGFHIFSKDEWLAQLQQIPGTSWLHRFWRTTSRSKLPLPKPQTVVYGHDSKAGLQLHRWSKGLDSGCVGGGELSALVLDARGGFEVRSVGCKNYK